MPFPFTGSKSQTDEPPALYKAAAKSLPLGDQIGNPNLAPSGSFIGFNSFVFKSSILRLCTK